MFQALLKALRVSKPLVALAGLLCVASAPAQAALAGFAKALATQDVPEQARSTEVSAPLDYMTLLPRDQARARAAKLRDRAR